MAEKETLPRISFTNELISVLKKLEAENNYLSFELLWMIEKDSKYHNGLRISKVDISKSDYSFDITIDGKKTPMKIGQFVRYFFKGLIADPEITAFSKSYNRIKGGGAQKETGTPIVVKEFSYNPKDVRSTFLSMVTKTYPHGHEEEVLQFLPELQKDSVGNYYKIIGTNPTTMFTSHLDTADRKQEVTKLFSEMQDGEEYIVTDGMTVLGADDKSGVAIMLYMMDHNIEGLYYFFIGEERGGIGSGRLSAIYDTVDYLKNIKRCISFDRRMYNSVITQQMGRRCCSDKFGTALCNEFTKGGLSLSLDPTGIYTDSASFIDDIQECTNISVGYKNEHTGEEYQNMTFLIELAKASVLVDWNSLPTDRKVGIDQEILKKYSGLITDIKAGRFGIETKVVGLEGKVFIRVLMDEIDVDIIHDSLIIVSNLLKKHRLDPDVTFSGTHLKIELR